MCLQRGIGRPGHKIDERLGLLRSLNLINVTLPPMPRLMSKKPEVADWTHGYDLDAYRFAWPTNKSQGRGSLKSTDCVYVAGPSEYIPTPVIISALATREAYDKNTNVILMHIHVLCVCELG